MRILIVDDHPVIIAGCRALFSAEEHFEVVDAKDAASALVAFKAHQPDISIIDIALPGVSGLDLTQQILLIDPKAKIIIFSMNDDPIFASRALKLGAQGYVAKNDNPYLLLEAVQKVNAGGLYLMPQMADALLLNATRQNADPWLQLNSRERDILRLIGEGFDLKEIAERTDVTYKTIANSCTLIKKKLGLRSSSDLSRKAVEYKNMI